ncbi:MAG: ECF transporter S component [Termitinemataceae bacterium]
MAVLPVRKIAVAGVLSAISIVLGITRLGFIPWFSGASVTVMQVPVIIGAVLEGPVVGLVIGFLFGLSSLLQAALAPTGPVDVAFTNPLISVLPRLFIGPVAYGLYRFVMGTARRTAAVGSEEPTKQPYHPLRLTIALALAGIGGSLTNTVLVLSSLGLFNFFPWALIITVAIGNGPAEAFVSALLTVLVVAAYLQVRARGPQGTSKLSKLEE